ncbi:MAG: hypothetical protein QXU40_00535 [Candidatus Pacearchaeota archaeon]
MVEKDKSEKDREKERIREIAIKNVSNQNLISLMVCYLVDQGGNLFGEEGNRLIERYIYLPSIEKLSNIGINDLRSGEEIKLFYNSLLGSRKEGKRYSGQISEYDLIKTATIIVLDSLMFLKVADITKFLNREVASNYSDKYIKDIIESSSEKDKNVARELIKIYQNSLIYQHLSKAYNKEAESISNNLEKILKEDT